MLPYLGRTADWGLDLELEVSWNGTVVSRPPFAGMYWTPDQQLAHLTVNGASLRTGDLYASGTVSGPERDQRGSFLELSWNGTEPVTLDDGSTRTFLEDGDVVSMQAWAPGADGTRIGFGEVTGRCRRARLTGASTASPARRHPGTSVEELLEEGRLLLLLVRLLAVVPALLLVAALLLVRRLLVALLLLGRRRRGAAWPPPWNWVSASTRRSSSPRSRKMPRHSVHWSTVTPLRS